VNADAAEQTKSSVQIREVSSRRIAITLLSVRTEL